MMARAWIRNTACGVLAGAALLIGDSPAGAQTRTWDDRGFVNVNIGIQPGSDGFTDASTPQINGEAASIAVPIAVGRSPLADVSAGLRVWKNVGFGVGYSRFSKRSGSTLNASVPNPILFNQPRAASAAVDALEHTESALHLEMLWMLPLSPDFDIAGILGGSIFMVTQDLVSGLTTTEGAPPFTSVSIASAQTVSASKTAPALTLGVDATYRVVRQAGVGVFVRYSRVNGGSVQIDDPGGSGAVGVTAGGLQAGIGLRARF